MLTWTSAPLTPYRLNAGRAPAGPREVVVDSRLRVPVGRVLRLIAPGGEASYRVSGVADGRANRDRGQAALFFAPGVGLRFGAPTAAWAGYAPLADQVLASYDGP